MKFKVGDECVPIDESRCPNYIDGGGAYIKIKTMDEDGYMVYDILNVRGKKVSYCYCFISKNLRLREKTTKPKKQVKFSLAMSGVDSDMWNIKSISLQEKDTYVVTMVRKS